MKNIHILNGQGGAEGPAPIIDEQMLEAELATGETCFAKVPLSQSHLFALVLASQVTCGQADCSPYVRTMLQDFQLWCARDAQFGPETRKLLAWSQAQRRNVAVTNQKS